MISPFPKMTEGQKLSFSLTAGQKECCTKAFFLFQKSLREIWGNESRRNLMENGRQKLSSQCLGNNYFSLSPASFSHIVMLTNRAA